MKHSNSLAVLFVLTLCLVLSGCLPHSVGGKRVTGDIEPPAGTVAVGKAIHVALAAPLPPGLADTPSFIIAQFCKHFAPVASSVSAGTVKENAEAALAEARENKSDYLAFLRVLRWKKGSMFRPGHRVHVEISLLDTATGTPLARHQIEANCYAMAMGLEQSPRECARPQVEQWTEQVFDVQTGGAAYTDPTTFPRQVPSVR